jgi:SAM-dependent methyltransferase
MNGFHAPIPDAALQELNAALPWHAGTLLDDGRLVGRLDARPHKREDVQPIPDKRIRRLDQALPLAGRTVLEVGCFEGIHTLGLRHFDAVVTAVDVRPMNVLKTLARLAAHGQSARVQVLDVEDPAVQLGRFDVVFHCGVLYHLEDPVRHLERLLPACDAIYLDTHVASDGRDSDELEVDGRRFRGYRHQEGGWQDPFSGRGASAFWLRADDLIALLQAQGFACEIWSERAERNGARIGLLATRRT